MVTTMIRKLKDMSKDEIRNLANQYSESYLRLLKEVLNQEKFDDDTIVYEEYTYKEIKEGIFEILNEIKDLQRLPVVNFAAGGIATPADAAAMMQLGSDGVFVGSGIFKSSNPEARARAIVEAVLHYDEPEIIAEVSKNLGEAMRGIEIEQIAPQERLQERGW